MNHVTKSAFYLAALTSATLIVSACHHNDDDNPPVTDARYQITVTNLTHNQPFSPPALLSHDTTYQVWSVGTPAGEGLEHLAESGDTATLIDEANAEPAVEMASAGSNVIAPGGSEQFTLTVFADDELALTVATMLVNTNDAFTGVNGINIGGLASGESISVNTYAYDAGTEANTETAATIPGPAAGGEGFNSTRESANQVTRHGGVVTQADGLTTSALDESHRFDNPVARIVITRQ